jgi:hypothetical protein
MTLPATSGAVGPRAGAAQQGTQPGQQFLNRERLHQIVVRAAIQAAHPIRQAVPRGDNQHRQGAARSA